MLPKSESASSADRPTSGVPATYSIYPFTVSKQIATFLHSATNEGGIGQLCNLAQNRLPWKRPLTNCNWQLSGGIAGRETRNFCASFIVYQFSPEVTSKPIKVMPRSLVSFSFRIYRRWYICYLFIDMLSRFEVTRFRLMAVDEIWGSPPHLPGVERKIFESRFSGLIQRETCVQISWRFAVVRPRSSV